MLSEKLKQETQKIHDEIEKNPFALKIKAKNINKDEYKELLQRFYYIHQLLENQLTQFDILQMDEKQRLSLLKEDLENLNFQDFDNINYNTKLPKINNEDEAFGVLYVLEGSRMGGMVICQLLSKSIKDNLPLKYFKGYENKTVENFLEFKFLLDNMHLNEKEVIKGAIKTFEFMKKILES